MWLVELVAAIGLCGRPNVEPLSRVVCSCNPEWHVRDRDHLRRLLGHTAAVFEGEILAQVPAPAGAGSDVLAFRVAIGGRWRGAAGDTVTVATPVQTTACGADLVVGKRFLIFATHERGGVFYTNKCVPTGRWGADAERLVDWLGPPAGVPGDRRPDEA